ncbi:restriction endonuclease subunit S [Thermoactinomyces mirandus]|uniref:Restriction endonuclease subunit S n=1 Tax=Thermoactinomyces mirandus TaxID=2756294 RepID=A0A7W2AQB9_9BACL|nr:restriction endonuclease subunit S [Thermoactinomyces mirandus]MBA4601804.1 restriction endonuclease subunit S [Thermoactinomyces mirandus]
MNELYQFKKLLAKRGITEPEQVAIELLRIHLTREFCAEHHIKDPHQRYAWMQEETGERLGFFQGEPTWFEELYRLGEHLDLVSAMNQLFRHDRSGVMVCKPPLANYLLERIMSPHLDNVLVAEAHKLLPDLIDWCQVCLDKSFVFTAPEKWQVELLRFLFRNEPSVTVIRLSIYHPLDFEQDFDAIIAIPAFGVKMDVDSDRYFTRESEGIALQNLLDFLSSQGEMHAVVPSRFTFSGAGFQKLREWILRHAFLSRIAKLPQGLLNSSGIRPYLLTFSGQAVEEVEIVKLELEQESLAVAEMKQVAPQLVKQREDWRFEVLYEQLALERLEAALGSYRLEKLADLGELFRGKSITKQQVKEGSIHVLNISNIADGEIEWTGLDTIDEPIRKVRRYELKAGDVVITCRGTVIKVGIVRELPFYTIASANLIVIRMAQSQIESEYVKIFLESPTGLKSVRTFQRGSKVMNIHPDDLGELEIPVPALEKQHQLIKKYRQEQKLFLEAKERWQKMRQTIYDQFT